jgi:hypothetical protein
MGAQMVKEASKTNDLQVTEQLQPFCTSLCKEGLKNVAGS